MISNDALWTELQTALADLAASQAELQKCNDLCSIVDGGGTVSEVLARKIITLQTDLAASHTECKRVREVENAARWVMEIGDCDIIHWVNRQAEISLNFLAALERLSAALAALTNATHDRHGKMSGELQEQFEWLRTDLIASRAECTRLRKALLYPRYGNTAELLREAARYIKNHIEKENWISLLSPHLLRAAKDIDVALAAQPPILRNNPAAALTTDERVLNKAIPAATTTDDGLGE